MKNQFKGPSSGKVPPVFSDDRLYMDLYTILQEYEIMGCMAVICRFVFILLVTKFGCFPGMEMPSIS